MYVLNIIYCLMLLNVFFFFFNLVAQMSLFKSFKKFPNWAGQPTGWLVYLLSEWVFWPKKAKKKVAEKNKYFFAVYIFAVYIFKYFS